MKKIAERTGIHLEQHQINAFEKYFEMLVEKNKVMNLTAITEREEVINKHFIDSLSCKEIIDLNKVKTVIDVGTGAGFPGIPLKIAFPHLNIVLMDSLNKRVVFLNEVIKELGLNEIKAVHDRAEEMAKKPEYRETFDLCVSRAVANLATLSEYCLPFVKNGGHFVSYKSGKAEEEISESEKAIDVLGGKIEEIKSFFLPGTDIERVLISIVKNNKTPDKYPRKPGTATKAPIK